MPADSRERMVRAAVALFRERGYAATSFHDVLDRSEAPRGSIYHHFPGGKEQLATEALRWYAGRVASALAGQSAADTVARFVTSSRDALVASDYSSGCAVAAVALDQEPALDAVVAEAFTGWRQALATTFTRDGATTAQARRLASLVVAAVEGALMLARAERSPQPLDDIARELRSHLDTVLPGR